jgi:hypothetical protein
MILKQRWETDTRYYVAMVQRDLFGDLEVLQFWGGKTSERGGWKKLPMPDSVAAFAFIEKIGKKRIAHKYRAINEITF